MFPLEPPSHLPASHPSRLSQSTQFELPGSCSKFSQTLYTHMVIYVLQCYSFNLSLLLLPLLCPIDCSLSAFSTQFSSVAQSCLTLCNPWTTAHQDPLSITNSRSLPKLMSVESVMPSNHLILCHPLLLLPSIFPSIRVFPNESVLHIR